MIMCGPSSETTQGQVVQSRREATVAHMGPSERENSALQESIIGDQGSAHSGDGEGYLDQRCRDGHRWRLGEWLDVIQKNEN